MINKAQRTSLLSKTKQLLVKYQISANAVRFGQHFLVDELVLNTFLKACELKATDSVLEIGPGLGLVTEKILQRVKKLTSVEIDSRFQPIHEELSLNFAHYIYIINNILTFPLAAEKYDLITGLLSYNLFEPLFPALVKSEFRKAVFLTSIKTLKEDSWLRFILEAFYDLEVVQYVSASSFFPKPKVGGVIFRLQPLSKITLSKYFWQAVYLQRDKKLKNALRESLILSFQNQKNTCLTKKQAAKLLLEKIEPNIDLNKNFSQLNKNQFLKLSSSINNLLTDF